MKKLFFFITLLVYFHGCTPVQKVYYDIPQEFKNDTLFNKYLVDCQSNLKGIKIFLDPGHGGDDRKNKGYLGLITEADANLRVGLFLRDFLTRAGAIVFMSREKDTTIDLKERSILANKSGADIFISIHHNAPGKEGDNYTNYTSTYYHAKEINYEYEPMERDLAKFIQRDLAYAMRNSGGLGSFDGTYSDYIIYPGSGFSVLRLTEIPSVLIECGFHTHNWEEQRIALEEFNKIQAWGIFRGICRYFNAGIPNIEFFKKEFSENKTKLFYRIKDRVGVAPNTISVYVDSTQFIPFNFDQVNSILTFELPSTLNNYLIRIIAANKNGNHSFPFQHILKKD